MNSIEIPDFVTVLVTCDDLEDLQTNTIGDNIDLSVFNYREKPIDPELPDGRKVETPAIIDMKCELSQLIDAMSGQKLNDLTNNGTVQHTNKGVMEQMEHIKKADKINIARTEDLDVNATKILKITTTQISTTEDNVNKHPLKELGDTEKKEVTEHKQKQPPVNKKTKRELRKERGVPGRNQQIILSNSQGPKADTPKETEDLETAYTELEARHEVFLETFDSESEEDKPKINELNHDLTDMYRELCKSRSLCENLRQKIKHEPDSLDMKYGRAEKLIDHILNELKRLKKVQEGDNMKFISLVETVEKCWLDLKRMNLEAEMNTATMLRLSGQDITLSVTKVGNVTEHVQSKEYVIPLTDLRGKIWTMKAYGMEEVTAEVARVDMSRVDQLFKGINKNDIQKANWPSRHIDRHRLLYFNAQ
ncbi:unnamed protein product [Mytilus coruscus]|uniref:Uncharacterized protein n=1 Tax=Mytilus coruscus TaxID=42192 RepID=A0A6J8F4B4_MYTCO|nr:unnamed protein product [Mytilus coruscus]